MEEKLLISVIVPIYNTEKYLAKCIDSILGQTYPNLEVLLINDGSTDRSPYICEEYSRVDKRVKVTHKKNEGVSSARNLGLELATGDFVSFVDADDWIERNTYAELVNCIEQNSVDVVLFEYFIDYENGETKRTSHKECEGVFNSGRAVELTISPINRFAVTKLYSRNIIGNTRFDTNIFFGEDTLFACTVLSKINLAYYLAKPYYHYYQSAVSATRSALNGKMLTGVEAYKQILELCTSKFPEIEDIAKSAYFNIIANILTELENYTEFRDSETIRKRLLSVLRMGVIGIMFKGRINNRMKLKFLLASINPGSLKNFRN